MFSTVFLCVKENNKDNFKCKEFKDFLKADKHFNDNYNAINYQSTMTPVCKFC
jgi:hypothetical protein